MARLLLSEKGGRVPWVAGARRRRVIIIRTGGLQAEGHTGTRHRHRGRGHRRQRHRGRRYRRQIHRDRGERHTGSDKEAESSKLEADRRQRHIDTEERGILCCFMSAFVYYRVYDRGARRRTYNPPEIQIHPKDADIANWLGEKKGRTPYKYIPNIKDLLHTSQVAETYQRQIMNPLQLSSGYHNTFHKYCEEAMD